MTGSELCVGTADAIKVFADISRVLASITTGLSPETKSFLVELFSFAASSSVSLLLDFDF